MPERLVFLIHLKGNYAAFHLTNKDGRNLEMTDQASAEIFREWLDFVGKDIWHGYKTCDINAA